MAWVIEVERWKSPLPVILVIKDKKKKRPAFVGRLFEMNQRREDVKKKVKEIVGNERKRVHWITRGELDFILRGINVARTDKAKQGIK